MRLIINGEEQDVGEARTVAQLIEQMGLGGAAVAVEVNREVIPRKQHADTTLNEGDVIEMVTLVGGG